MWKVVEENKNRDGEVGGKRGKAGVVLGGRERSGSTGRIDEILKRKRVESEIGLVKKGDEGSWAFNRSKKLQRSPGKSEGGGEDLRKLVEEIRGELREGREESRKQGRVIVRESAILRKELNERGRKNRDGEVGEERGKAEGVVLGGRERRDSTGRIDEMLERKRLESEVGLEKKGEEGSGAFNSSKELQRSPGKNEGGLEELSRLMREMKGELREVREEGRKRGMEIRKEIEGLKEDMRKREEEGKAEKEEMRRRIEKLEEKVGKQEEGDAKVGEERGTEDKGREKEMGRRVRILEREAERREREKRRVNIIIKGMQLEGKGAKEAAVEVLKDIGVEGGIKEVREVGGRDKEGRGMVVVKMTDREKRREVWDKKKKLRGRKERIEDDMTWRERKVQGELRRIGWEQERKGKRTWIGYGK